jgi:alcohol dehydrogenase (NADP+)
MGKKGSAAPLHPAVDPARVPFRVLDTGAKMPCIGLGTFGSDRFSAEQVAETVRDAIAAGYRLIDCASVYGNEDLIGRSLHEAMQSGTRREQLWITSKVWNDMHGDGQVLSSCEKSLRDLRLEYLDLYLVHWPFPNFHARGADVGSRDPHARPYIHEEYMKVWRQMERLVDMGLVRHIGTSNVTIPKLKLLLRDARIRPSCNEMELHPHFQQPDFFRFIEDQGMIAIGFCPIGSPTRPDRDRSESDTVDIEDPVIEEIAQELSVHPAVVCVKWAIQRGQVPIPFSVHRNEYVANLKCAVSRPLTQEDMARIATIDRNCRLIKGQVFLWKEGQSWEDLWDMNGEISPP